MKCGFPFSREREKEFAYWILTSQSSAGLSLLASFRNIISKIRLWVEKKDRSSWKA